MDKQALFVAAIAADPATVQAVSENRFAIVTPNEANGTPTVRGEYHVWTPEEAAGFGYVAGGVPTSDPGYLVYRVA